MTSVGCHVIYLGIWNNISLFKYQHSLGVVCTHFPGPGATLVPSTGETSRRGGVSSWGPGLTGVNPRNRSPVKSRDQTLVGGDVEDESRRSLPPIPVPSFI